MPLDLYGSRPRGLLLDPYGDDTCRVICERVVELRGMNRNGWHERMKLKEVLSGNERAARVLVGDRMKDTSMGMPVANFILSAAERVAWKLERPPDVKTETPSESQRAKEGAEKRARIVEHYDRTCGLELRLMNVARWLPTFGFAPLVVRTTSDCNGQTMPGVELRDPWESFPGEWGVAQQPRDIAFVRVIGLRALADMFPQHARRLLGDRFPTGPVILGQSSWANQSGAGVEVYEYMNAQGIWWVCPEYRLLLSYEPNLLASGPPFYVMKRPAFDHLAGQYDQALGLMQLKARMNLLLVIGTEDSVMAETNVVGDLSSGTYRRGRNAVNYFEPGSSVQKMNSHVPYEAFQQAASLEKDIRTVANYPGIDDGNSPMSFVTGRGLEQLGSSGDLMIRELQTVVAYGLMAVDSKRLELDEVLQPNVEKQIQGTRKDTPFSESYTPAKHIAGQHMTRRVYGAMAGFDEATKIITGLQLTTAEIIDDDTMRENIDGLEDHTRIKERILANKATKVAFDTLLAMANSGDPRAMMAAIELIPPGDMRDVLERVFTPPEEEQPAVAPPVAPPELGGAGEDVATVLSRLTPSGGTGGLQTVSRVA